MIVNIFSMVERLYHKIVFDSFGKSLNEPYTF